LTKLSGGAGGLGDSTVEDDGDTCQNHVRDLADTLLQGVGDLGFKTAGRRILGFGPQNLVRVSKGMGGSMWHHREACIEVKQSREEPVAIGCLDLKLDNFAPRLGGSTIKYLRHY
jgi:hypothetical protein